MVKDVAERGKITLCGVQGCCPTIDFTVADQITICDDFGGKVKLTQDQWSDLKRRFVSKSVAKNTEK